MMMIKLNRLDNHDDTIKADKNDKIAYKQATHNGSGCTEQKKPNIYVDSNFLTYFGASLSKQMRRFDLLLQILIRFDKLATK